MKTIGKAYGFFDCNASKEKIESNLPSIRELACTPSNLELLLKEVKELKEDKQIDFNLLKFINENQIYPTFPSKLKDLMKTAKPIKMADLKYVIEAIYPNAISEAAASELSDVMNYIYMEFGNQMPFNTAIICKINRQYYFKE